MTHFLARLVERARGTAPRVAPLLVPRFAAAPVPELSPEPEAAVTHAAAEVAPAIENKPPVRRHPQVKSESRPLPHGSLGKKTEETLLRSEAPIDAPIEVVRDTLLVPGQAPEATPPKIVRQTEIAEREVVGAPREVERSQSARRRVLETTRVRPFPAESARPTLQPHEQSKEPPIVRVTIGRIDVRAAPAPASAPRRPARDAQPKLTLDAYLKSRREGAR